jgi:branched-chain amino acid transport system substrate-binding protein
MQKQFKQKLWFAAALCAVGYGNTASAAGTQVVIGMAAPLTGAQAAYGKNVQNGIRLALEEANAQKIIVNGAPATFVLDSKDDQADPRIGTQVAQRLVDDKVAVVVGHFNSGTTLPASKIYAQAGIPMITPGANNSSITQAGYTTLYRVIGTDSQLASKAGAYAVKNLHAKRISTLDDRTAFGQGEADEFVKAVKANGGEVVKREFTNDNAVDFSSQLTNVKAAQSDLLFFGGMDKQAAMITRRMKQLGMKTQFVGGSAILDDLYLKIAGDAAEGQMVWEFGKPIEGTPEGRAFVEKYSKEFGAENLDYAGLGYDGAKAAILAIQKAGSTDPAKINAALKTLDFQGATGHIAFEKNGDLKDPGATLYVVKQGKFQPVQTEAAAQ